MEFTLARVTLGVCGMVLLAAVISPVADICDDREESDLQTQCDLIAGIIDAFWDSETDDITLNLNSILPSDTGTLSFDGYIIKMTSDDREYRSASKLSVSSDTTYDANDVLRLTKNADGVIAEKL